MLSSCSHVSVKVSALPHVLLRSSEPLHKPGPHPDSIQMCSFLHPQEDRCRLKKGCKISTDGAFVKTNKKSTKSASLKANWQATISPRTFITNRLHLVSYYTVIGRLLHQFGREQGMLGRVWPLGLRKEKAYFLIGSSPLRVQLTVVAERHLWSQKRRQQKVHFQFELDISIINCNNRSLILHLRSDLYVN